MSAGRPVALTIAGSDSSGGAGIQADLKTFSMLGIYGASVITALTAQNTVGVTGVLPTPPDFVAAQIDAVCRDLGVVAVKTGMLPSAEIIDVVVDGIDRPMAMTDAERASRRQRLPYEKLCLPDGLLQRHA